MQQNNAFAADTWLAYSHDISVYTWHPPLESDTVVMPLVVNLFAPGNCVSYNYVLISGQDEWSSPVHHAYIKAGFRGCFETALALPSEFANLNDPDTI